MLKTRKQRLHHCHKNEKGRNKLTKTRCTSVQRCNAQSSNCLWCIVTRTKNTPSHSTSCATTQLPKKTLPFCCRGKASKHCKQLVKQRWNLIVLPVQIFLSLFNLALATRYRRSRTGNIYVISKITFTSNVHAQVEHSKARYQARIQRVSHGIANQKFSKTCLVVRYNNKL